MVPRSSSSLIVVPYVDLHPATGRAVEQTNRQALYVPLTSDDAYWQLLRCLWRRGDTFTVIEQDIIPTPAALDGFDRCPEPWCACPYAVTTRYAAWLGCVRIRDTLTAGEPDVLDVVGAQHWPNHPPRHWRPLADLLWFELGRRGYRCHVHMPPLAHLNPHQRIKLEDDRGWCHFPARLDPR